jgi:small subunit ribosomal protein S8
MAIAKILARQNYIAGAEEVKNTQSFPYIVISLKYDSGVQAIRHISRVSKPGRRLYVKKDKIPAVLNGLGLSILSTPRGLMTDTEARKAKLGGEIICEVY